MPPRTLRARAGCGRQAIRWREWTVKQARAPQLGPATRSSSADGVAGAAQLACVLEASAEKPGNITPRHDFADTSYEDMLRSAIALGPELARAAERGVGDTVLAAVRATRRVAGANTNLGIALLLAPLARAALLGGPLRERAGGGAGALDAATTRAPRTRRSAGRARAASTSRVEHDVRAAPTVGAARRDGGAADRDSVAAEYATGYAVTFETRAPGAGRALDDGLRPRAATSSCHLALLAAVPDTLIARKRGRDAAERVSAGAARVLAAGGVRSDAGRRSARRAFDASLREDGNALNPGTTADLVTAVLFVALLEGLEL